MDRGVVGEEQYEDGLVVRPAMPGGLPADTTTSTAVKRWGSLDLLATPPNMPLYLYSVPFRKQHPIGVPLCSLLPNTCPLFYDFLTP